MKSFLKNLTSKTFATKKQIKNEIWDVKGRLKNGNKIFKFDIRPLNKIGNRIEKTGFFNTKADKIVFENEKKWIVFDVEELHEYIKTKDKKDFNIDELLKELSWNSIINKNE